jgi:hypothetical protein
MPAGNGCSPFSVKAGKNLSFSLSASDPDGDFLVYTASNLPPGATFDSQTGRFSWTPGYDQAGIYNVHFEVSDGSLTDAEDITITVNDIEMTTKSQQFAFLVSSLKISPSQANVGKKISISAAVINNGNSTGQYEVILTINGAIAGRKTVTLSGGASQTVKFSASEKTPGTYQVDVNGLTGSFVVVKQARGK